MNIKKNDSIAIGDTGGNPQVSHTLGMHEQLRYIFAPSSAGTYEHTFELGLSSELTYFLMLTNSCSISLHLKIILSGEHAQAHVNGLYLLADSQQVSITTEQIHRARATQSMLHINGALTDHAFVSYAGMIHIAEQATHAQAGQENKNIILSDDARAQSVPSLEVLTHEVQCGHGTAVGRFDEQQLWYMQSRGLSEQYAKKLLLAGFTNAALFDFDEKYAKNIKLRLARMVE